MRKILIFAFIILFSLLTFSEIYSQEDDFERANKYYLSGIRAMKQENYSLAEKLFYKAMEISPEFEVKVPEVKLYLGICAFYLKKYDVAQTYLSLFPDNEQAKLLLKMIEEGNLKRKLSFTSLVKKETQTPESTVSTDNIKKKAFLFISITIFSVLVGSAILTYFLITKVFKISFGEAKATTTYERAEARNVENEVSEASLTLDEVKEIRLDQVFQALQEYNEILTSTSSVEESVEELPSETETVSESETEQIETNFPEDLSQITESIPFEETELEKAEKTEGEEEKESSQESEKEEETEELEKIPLSDEGQLPPELITEPKPIEEIETISPSGEILRQLKKILNEPEVELDFAVEKDVDQVIEEIENDLESKGDRTYTAYHLQTLFKHLFAQEHKEGVQIT